MGFSPKVEHIGVGSRVDVNGFRQGGDEAGGFDADVDDAAEGGGQGSGVGEPGVGVVDDAALYRRGRYGSGR